MSVHSCFFSDKKQAGFTYVVKNIFKEDVIIDKKGRLVEIDDGAWICSNILLLLEIII